MIKKILQFIIAVGVSILGFHLLQQDFVPFLQWWLTVCILGFIFMPLSSAIFSSFHDKGYIFSKVIGIAITGYLMWLLSSLHILRFTTVSCIISAGIALIMNGILILIKDRKKSKDPLTDRSKSWSILGCLKSNVLESCITEELLFFTLLLIFVYIRGFKPEAYGTEKFMDYGFMTSMMRSDYMPPQDFWFSGTSLNYYYVGQYMATFLTRLSFVKVSQGYNLMLMMIAAMAFVLAYSLVFNLTLQHISDRGKRSRLLPGLSGIAAGAGVCVAGNMHFPVYYWFENHIKKFLGIELNKDNYWFPDATRFIGYHPETNDKTIHEFPAYSFVLGDLHAHVINIIFVLTVIGTLLAWSIRIRKNGNIHSKPIYKEIFQPEFLLIGFFIGLFHTTNFWDFPIYYVVSGAIILFSNMVVYNFKVRSVWITLLQGIFIFGFSTIICLPFTSNFDQISTNICLAGNHTPLNQLVILWGLPIYAVVSFLIYTIADYFRRHRDEIGKVDAHRQLAIFRYMEELQQSDLFIITIGLCAIGLVLLPEIIYVQDIYSGDYKRANTMFKLTYQAFIMFGLCFGYLFVRLIRYGETWKQRKTTTIVLVLFALTLVYSQNAVKAWYGNIFDRKGYEGIDCAAFMENETPDDYLATKWLNENVTGMPVVLEANGKSYTDYQRVSVITGLPTVLGWETHEWLWKSNYELYTLRAADVQTIYTSTDENMVKQLLDQYDIEYIYVGKLENEKYGNVNHDLLKSLGEIVFMSLSTGEKAYETYIIRVDR